MLVVYMENSEIVEEREVKHKIPYHTVLMSALSEASRAIIYGDPLPALEVLYSILPPEIRQELADDWANLHSELRRAVEKIREDLSISSAWYGFDFSTAFQHRVSAVVRRLCSRFLSRVVDVLDDNGLLREFKKEEIGGI